MLWGLGGPLLRLGLATAKSSQRANIQVHTKVCIVLCSEFPEPPPPPIRSMKPAHPGASSLKGNMPKRMLRRGCERVPFLGN